MATYGALPDQIIYLIIRFASSLQDVPLIITSPHTTTTLSLKQLIRTHLPPPHDIARLRLIYSGRVLTDTAPLSLSLKLPPPPPPRHGTHNDDYGPGSKSKGKQPVRDAGDDPSMAGNRIVKEHPSNVDKFYIHCSMGDALSVADLAAEAAAASSAELALRKQYHSRSSTRHVDSSSSSGGGARTDEREGHSSADKGSRRESSTSTTQTPLGFDRLLTSGFTTQEVATLRSQFQSNISYTHTPDTMPSASALRLLEDRWLDSTATDPSPGTALGGSGGTDTGDPGWGAGFAAEDGGLDDMLWGYLTGFFFPLLAVVGGFREEGVWSRRRQLAVVMGAVLNAVFGFMRWGS